MAIGVRGSSADDEVASLTRLLEEAVRRLDRAGEGDAAARVAAQAWAALQVRRPDQARRFEVALHRLSHRSRTHSGEADRPV